MRRWMCLGLALLLLALALGAQAGSLRHQVTGDVSRLEASEAQSRAQVQGGQAQIGTDVYLFVDPDTASDITFRVMDDEGRAVPGAQIYISYKRATELYGTSGTNGKCTMYLFRGERYGYRVVKSGYLQATGTFRATDATKTVTAVLRKLHTLSVYVVKDGRPVPAIPVQAAGQRARTNAQGRAQAQLPNGRAEVAVTLPGGRRLTVPVLVRGDTAVVVDISEGDGLLDDGLGVYQDRFLVVDGGRACRDYALTEYRYDASDIARLPGETDQAYGARVARYLASNPNLVLVEAQPEADGSWGERSMVPSGALLQRLQARDYALMRFACGPVSVTVALDELLGDAMAQAAQLLAPGAAGGEALSEALFELRIVPIAGQALREMVEGGLGRAVEQGGDEVMLASPGHFQAVMRQKEAQGLITQEESRALCALVVDGRLSRAELAALGADYAAGRLGGDALDALIDGALACQMRRVQWLLSYAGEQTDVSPYLPSMAVHWDAEALIRGGYSVEALAGLSMVSVAGGQTGKYPLALENRKPDPDGEFYGVLAAKRMRRAMVRVGREQLLLGGQALTRDCAQIDVDWAQLPTQDDRWLTARAHVNGLYGLVRDGQ